MRLCTIRLDDEETAAVLTERGIVPLRAINAWLGRSWPLTLDALIERGLSPQLHEDAQRTPHALRPAQVRFAPLYRRPRKICGVAPASGGRGADAPACFLKGDHTIIGSGDAVVLPADSARVSAAAGLGVIVGRACRDVPEDQAVAMIAGYCAVLDMTDEGVLQGPSPCLTRAKNFDTFFSFGPELITPDEVPDVEALRVATCRNGAVQGEQTVAQMAFSPYHLLSWHSRAMTLFPGDIVSTGATGAVAIEHGDLAECRIDGLGRLANPVRRVRTVDFSALASAGV